MSLFQVRLSSVRVQPGVRAGVFHDVLLTVPRRLWGREGSQRVPVSRTCNFALVEGQLEQN